MAERGDPRNLEACFAGLIEAGRQLWNHKE